MNTPDCKIHMSAKQFHPMAQAIQSPPWCCRFNSLIFYGLTASILTSPLQNASGQGCIAHHLVLRAYIIVHIYTQHTRALITSISEGGQGGMS